MMSTRSGKRIHASVDSPTVNIDITLQSERKTRSKKQKENVELSVKKRHNYVSYPADEDTASLSSDAAETEKKGRKTGKNQRSVLKDHNVYIPVSDNPVSNDNNRTIRKTRKSKKVIEESDHTEEIAFIQNPDTSEAIASDKKLDKKKKDHVIKKKGTKKKKKGSKSNQEPAQLDTGIDNASVDSFHSAAGSPAKVILTENDKESESATNFVKQTVEDNIFTSLIIPADIPIALKAEGVLNKNKRKSAMKNSVSNKSEMGDFLKEINDATLHDSCDLSLITNSTAKVATKKKSSINNSTFDKIETKDYLHTPLDKTADVPKKMNSTIDASTKRIRKSSIKNSTFDKIETEDYPNTTVDKTTEVPNVFNTTVDASMKRIRKSSIKNSTFDKIEIEDYPNTTVDKTTDILKALDTTADASTKRIRKSSIKNSTFDKIEYNINAVVDHTTDVLTASNTADVKKRKKSSMRHSMTENIEKNCVVKNSLNKTFDEINDKSASFNTTGDVFSHKTRKSNVNNSTFDKIETKNVNDDNFNSTFSCTVSVNSLANGELRENNDKPHKLTILDDTKTLNNTYNNDSVLNSTDLNTSNRKRKSGVLNSTFDKQENYLDRSLKDANKNIQNKQSSQKNSIESETMILKSIVESSSKDNVKTTKLDSTFDKDNNIALNSTYESKNKSEMLRDSVKSSLNNSDAIINVTFDKSENNSRVSITSDESKTENILNHTPVLIESSIDESLISEDKTPEKLEVPVTPLKREGTFTKEASDIVASPKPKASAEKTPVKRKSSPGCTPFPFSKSSQKEKTRLNVTRSIEKSLRRSSLVEAAPRQTKVMFCSPVDNPATLLQIKGRVIKSNLKGSNKSFVFEDSESSGARACRRKRSFTAGDSAACAKRKRLGDELQHSVDRLSRPRTQSAAAKLPEPGTPSKKPATPSRARPESRVSRTKLPNFAALHQKQFAKMESLDECQERRARRARQLLTPTGSVGLLERISPKGTPPKVPAPAKEPAAKLHTPSKPKLPTLDTLIPGYTRFGFKLNVDANPFSVSRKPEPRKGSNGLSRQTTCLALPSLAGATATRKEAAKQTVMRDKSFTERRDLKRKETRTVIKGVRTNRRFELQMRHRTING